MTRDREMCFTISTLAGKGRKRRRVAVQPVWLNKRQMERLLLIFCDAEPGDRDWQNDYRTHRELREKRLITMINVGFRFHKAALTEDGQLLAESLVEAATKAKVLP